MAEKKQDKITWSSRLLSKLAVAPENRSEPAKGKYPGGRFKRFFDIFRSNMQSFVTINLLTLIFAIPVLVLLGFIYGIGMERFSYMLEKIDRTPYLLSGFGFGLSAGTDLAATKITMLMGYRVLFLGLAVCLPILGFGIAGSLYVCTKLVWGESFLCKKDKYGNDVPRIATEYFRGLKKYWKEPVLIFAVLGVIVAGCSNLIINFVAGVWSGQPSAGEIIGLIAAILIALPALLLTVNLLPTTVSYYGMPFGAKLKNSVLVTISFIVPTLFILVFAAAPLLLMLTNNFIAIILAVAFVTIGFSYIVLLLTNYADRTSELILVPLYEATQRTPSTKKKKKKNK